MVQPNGSLFGGLSRVILTLVVIGVVTGLVLGGADIVNFITNSAKAEAIHNANQLQAQKNAIDLNNYQLLQDAATQAQIDKMKADNEANQLMLDQAIRIQAQKAAQELETARWMSYIKMGALAILAVALGIGLVILAFRISFNRTGRSRSRIEKKSRFNNPDYVMARANELQNRKELLKETSYTPGIPVEWNNIDKKEYVPIRNRKE